MKTQHLHNELSRLETLLDRARSVVTKLDHLAYAKDKIEQEIAQSGDPVVVHCGASHLGRGVPVRVSGAYMLERHAAEMVVMTRCVESLAFEVGAACHSIQTALDIAK